MKVCFNKKCGFENWRLFFFPKEDIWSSRTALVYSPCWPFLKSIGLLCIVSAWQVSLQQCKKSTFLILIMTRSYLRFSGWKSQQLLLLLLKLAEQSLLCHRKCLAPLSSQGWKNNYRIRLDSLLGHRSVPSLPFITPQLSVWAKLDCILGGDSATVPGAGCHGLIGLIVRKLFMKLGDSRVSRELWWSASCTGHSPCGMSYWEKCLRWRAQMHSRGFRFISEWQRKGSQQEGRVTVHFGEDDRHANHFLLIQQAFSFSSSVLWSVSIGQAFCYLFLFMWSQQSSRIQVPITFCGAWRLVWGNRSFAESREEKPAGNTKLWL